MRYTVLVLVVMMGCPYEAPLNTVSAPPILNAVNGTVLFAGEGDVAPTYVTVFAADNPGPPAGTGQPITFTAVAGEAYSVGAAGLRSAPYAVTRLANGSWLLNALMDQDGDFNPFSGALAGATCGDWGGAYLSSLDPPAPAALDVKGGALLDDITIVVGQEFETERPAFVFSGTPQLKLGDLDPTGLPLAFRLRTTTVATAFSEDLQLVLGPACEPATECGPTEPACLCRQETFAPCGTAFSVLLTDADQDGVVDPYPSAAQAERGLLDIWPRVYLEYVGELGTFEVEDRVLPERWVAESFPLAREIGGAALQNEVPPGVAAAAFGEPGRPFAAYELSVTFAPVFRHYHASGSAGEDVNGPFDVVDLAAGGSPADVPIGGWAVTLVSYTGQTWTVPNDIGLLGLPSLDAAFDPVSQGAVMAIVP